LHQKKIIAQKQHSVGRRLRKICDLFGTLSFLSLLAFLPCFPWFQKNRGFCYVFLKKNKGFGFFKKNKKRQLWSKPQGGIALKAFYERGKKAQMTTPTSWHCQTFSAYVWVFRKIEEMVWPGGDCEVGATKQ